MTNRKESKAVLRDWLYKLPVTHAATVNLKSTHRTTEAVQQVTRRLLFKFNERIWGRNTWKRGTGGKQLSVLPIIHAEKDVDDSHIHFAFFGFPENLTEQQIQNRFYSAAKHTDGVQFVWQERNSADSKSRLAVDFERADSGGAWMNYITRKLSGSNDENILYQHMHISSST